MVYPKLISAPLLLFDKRQTKAKAFHHPLDSLTRVTENTEKSNFIDLLCDLCASVVRAFGIIANDQT